MVTSLTGRLQIVVVACLVAVVPTAAAAQDEAASTNSAAAWTPTAMGGRSSDQPTTKQRDEQGDGPREGAEARGTEDEPQDAPADERTPWVSIKTESIKANANVDLPQDI